MFKIIVSSILLSACISAKAQKLLSYKFDGSEQSKPLLAILKEIENTNDARFYFVAEWLEPFSLQKSYAGQSLDYVLSDLFVGTELDYFSMYPDAVVIIKDPSQALHRRQAIETAIRLQKEIVKYIFGEVGKPAKAKVRIRGKVVNSKTGEPMPGTTVQVNGTSSGTTTDDSGTYDLYLSPGVYVLNFSFVNYEDRIIDLAAYADGEINIEMEATPTLLQEVIIQNQFNQDITTSRIGETELSIIDVKRSPTLLGEADLIKLVQLLPGVTTVGEAASGFNVRGGSVDQNLILYDGMPVFNSSHVFGFLSAFNPEAIRNVTFYRGGIPAEYGGRTSSVLDIRSSDGDYQKWKGNAGIGMITSNVMVNGPLQKGKTSIAASFRSTYSNWLVHSVRTDYADLSNSSVFFYDGTLKLSHLLSDRTKLSFTGYASEDAFTLLGDSTYQWNNHQISAKVDHQISSRLNSEFVLGASSYSYSVTNNDYLTAFELSYRITSSVAKAMFNYQTQNHKVNFGWQLVHYGFDPGSFKPVSPVSNAQSISLDNQYSIESAFHAGDEWQLTDRFYVEGGIRLPLFMSFGRADINIYEEGRTREHGGATDTLNFRRGEIIKAFYKAEPRLSFRWMASATASVKLGYNRMYQFLHLVTNTAAVTPVDIWQPSGYYFKPQRADQVSLGYFKDLRDKQYSLSTEVFYKEIDNILDFKDGAQLILNDHLETDLLQGKGLSYGVESSISKNAGRLTGSLNYTWSRSFRLFAGSHTEESINQRKRYPSNFDQPHIANLSWKYNLSRKYSLTGNFIYHTGRPVTVPISAFPLENTTVAYFSGRNQYRIPDYHRLDLALIVEGSNKRNKKLHGRWVFTVFNVYGRKNPYTVFFKNSGAGVPKPYQLSIIGTVLPSISYNVTF